MDELLPCPFCGSIEITIDENGYGAYWALCEGCGVVTSESEVHSRGEAVARWNRRFPVSANGDGK